MTALWTYPWTLTTEGIAAACDDVADRGVGALNVASHYHSVRSMRPRFPDDLFRQYAGGCYFDPDPERFADTPIDPVANDVAGLEDPLETIVETAADRGVDVNAWTVCLHNSRLGAGNPDFRIESAFGDAHEHSLCPSHPEVREYFAAVVEAVADRGVAEIQLESVGFPGVFHGHGAAFGHDKRQVLTSETEEVLCSQCFCDGCRRAATDHAVDLEAAREVVRSIVRDSFAEPHADPPSLDALVREEPVLRDLFDFRASVVDRFVERLADAAGSTPLNYYVMESSGPEPGAGWPAGVRLSDLENHLDRATAICYEDDPAVVRDRIRTLRRTIDLPVDAGLTLDPDVISDEARFRAVFDAARTAADGQPFVYHHGLATDAQLDWVARAVDG